MTRQFENPQPSLFDEDEPRVELAPAEKIGLAALLLEIATALANGETGDDHDHG